MDKPVSVYVVQSRRHHQEWIDMASGPASPLALASLRKDAAEFARPPWKVRIIKRTEEVIG